MFHHDKKGHGPLSPRPNLLTAYLLIQPMDILLRAHPGDCAHMSPPTGSSRQLNPGNVSKACDYLRGSPVFSRENEKL
jgi:hypothetical protein